MLGAADGILKSIRARMLHIDQDAFDEEVSRLRAQVDREVFDAAWNEGQALTVEEAIRL